MEELRAVRIFQENPIQAVISSDIEINNDPAHISNLVEDILKRGSIDEVERLQVIEQGYLASLKLKNLKKATEYLEILNKNLGNQPSSRLEILHARLLESKDEHLKAIQIYEKLIEQDETNVNARKHKISALISLGKIENAIESLVEYVDIFMQDVDAWNQLAQLYFQDNRLKQAAFCYEECILQRPMIHLYHVQYAKTLFLLGKPRLSLKHYCRALELCQDFGPALLGIKYCCKQIGIEDPVIKELLEFSESRIKD